MKQSEVQKLRSWFLSQKRDLPWRENPTPYAVWVSEVMLQQTQVSVVIPYFLRWMEKFPTIKSLAEAPIEEVIKEWEGLGYYTRVRNLHEGAHYVVKNHAGKLPSTAENLSKIKGLGAYTIGAILSFAFHQKAAAVDGNVLRVLSRYYSYHEDISKPKTVKKIREMAQLLLPDYEPWIISEALIELGATICARTPKCPECPLKNECKGYLEGNAHDLPVKSQKNPITSLFRGVTVIECEEQYLVVRGEKGKLMADLYQFPYFESDNFHVEIKNYQKWLYDKFKISADWQMSLPPV
jgi:A/G-specific adenine glycosylase